MQTNPMNENTTAEKMTFIEKIDCDVIRLENDTSADLDDGDFAVIAAKWCGIAQADIDDGDTGAFYVEEGLLFQTDELKARENTFGTVGQEVYWDDTSKEFSDTETDGYYLIGTLKDVKNTAGVIGVEKYRYATLVELTT